MSFKNDSLDKFGIFILFDDKAVDTIGDEYKSVDGC